MKRETGLLLVGGAKRNVGKTTLVCKIINQFSKDENIIGLKLKTISEGDNYFHGKDSNSVFSKYQLSEEQELDSFEDTGKMLRAGAKRAFLLRSKSEYLFEAFNFFISKLNETDLIICESNSLRKFIEPDLYLFIKNKDNQEMKPSATELEKLANLIIYTDGLKHNFDLNQLKIENHEWSTK